MPTMSTLDLYELAASTAIGLGFDTWGKIAFAIAVFLVTAILKATNWPVVVRACVIASLAILVCFSMAMAARALGEPFPIEGQPQVISDATCMKAT